MSLPLIGLLSLLGLAGCASQNKLQKLEPILPKVLPPPPPSCPEEEYSEDFGDDEHARRYYTQLKELEQDSCFNQRLDRGCPIINYNQDGIGHIEVIGKGDKKHESCEVYEYVLEPEEEQYQKDPAAYRAMQEDLAGKPIPWSLNDYDESTTFDAHIRAKIESAIRLLDEDLKRRGFDSQSIEYQERMAVWLLAYISFPKASEFYRFSDFAEELSHKLEQLDMASYVHYLQRNGGLRLEGDRSVELPALQALMANKGECTESSKVVYAAYKLAGLKPFFVYVDPWKSEEPFITSTISENPQYLHICIGLKIDGKLRLFDASLMNFDVSHHHSIPLSLVQYLGFDYTNRGMAGSMPVLLAYNTAIRLDPNGYFAFSNRARFWAINNQFEKAENDLKFAIEINPASLILYFNLGFLKSSQGQLDEALEIFNNLIKREPSFALAHMGRAFVFLDKGKSEEAFEGLVTALRIAPILTGQFTLTELDGYLGKKWEEPSLSRQKSRVKKETSFLAHRIETQITFTGLLWKAGHTELARKELKIGLTKILNKSRALASQKLHFSPLVKKFFRSLFDNLPAGMQQAEELKSMRKSFGL